MHFPKLPDWLVYAAVVLALLIAAVGRQERADAPPPPPPVPGEEGVPVGPASPFDPSIVVDVPANAEPGLGTAFSVAERGVWVTARHVVDGCTQAAIVVAEGRGVAAKVSIDQRGEAAILTTEGGAPPLPLGLDQKLRRGDRAYHPGFPQGQSGEATSRLLGRENLVVRGRGARTEPERAADGTRRHRALLRHVGEGDDAVARRAAGASACGAQRDDREPAPPRPHDRRTGDDPATGDRDGRGDECAQGDL